MLLSTRFSGLAPPFMVPMHSRSLEIGGLSMNRASPGLRPPSPRLAGRGQGDTAIELRRNGFFPILIVILLLISKNLSRARLRLGLRLRACQCGPAAGLNSMAVHNGGEGG